MPSPLWKRLLVVVVLVSGCADIPDPDSRGAEETAEASEPAPAEQGAASSEGALLGRKRCGGPLNFRCGSSEVCSIPSDGGCPSPKAYGSCEPRRLCPQIFDPVCGCDGKTYSNACSAGAAGVAVQYKGACVPSGPSCGGFAGIECPGEGACIDDPRDECDPLTGGADCSGICTCDEPHTCPAGSRFDSRPSVCACVREPFLCPTAPCAVTLCAAGTRCVERDCKAVCEPFAGCLACPPGAACTDVCLPGPIPID